jgi:hypothetical protein
MELDCRSNISSPPFDFYSTTDLHAVWFNPIELWTRHIVHSVVLWLPNSWQRFFPASGRIWAWDSNSLVQAAFLNQIAKFQTSCDKLATYPRGRNDTRGLNERTQNLKLSEPFPDSYIHVYVGPSPSFWDTGIQRQTMCWNWVETRRFSVKVHSPSTFHHLNVGTWLVCNSCVHFSWHDHSVSRGDDLESRWATIYNTNAKHIVNVSIYRSQQR